MTDTTNLSKIAKLLRHAESSSNEHEADAYLQAAQRLATAASLDLEVARQHTDKTERRAVPVQKHITIGERGKKGLSTFVTLFSGIANANDVKLNIAHNSTYVIAFGFDTDIEVVEALYQSLVIQMVTASTAYLRAGDYKDEKVWSERKFEYVPVHGHTARRAFQQSFAYRISERLQQARRDALTATQNRLDREYADAKEEHRATERTSTDLVLAAKSIEVSDFYRETSRARGSYKGSQARGYSSSASRAGAEAGSRARIGAQQAIGGGQRALTR